MKHLVSTQDFGDFELEHLNPKASKISQSLGISDDRFEELCYIVEKNLIIFDSITEAMSNISLKVDHQNELAIAMFHCGVVVTHLKNSAAAQDQITAKIKEYEEKHGISDDAKTPLGDLDDLTFEDEPVEEEEDLTFED